MHLTDDTRVYVRCSDCLAVSMIHYREIKPERPDKDCRLSAACGVCGGPMVSMGPVSDRWSRIVTSETLECMCDERCATATGPSCTCRCGGKNHGLNMGAYVTKTATDDVPTITPKSGADKCRARATEYRAAVDAAMARIQAHPHYGTYSQSKNGKWVDDWCHVMEIKHMLQRVSEAKKGKTHKGRMAKLAGIVA